MNRYSQLFKRQFGIFAFVFGMLLAATAVRAQNEPVSFDFFYDQLAPYGDWVTDPYYGSVWTPNDVDYDWRPFTDGRWAYTDDGWLWVSYKPWGWLTYHYGRWFYDYELDRWMWVPGMIWSPGWVVWRSSGDYIGWAPTPVYVIYADSGLRWDWDRYFHECDVYYRHHDRDRDWDRYHHMRDVYFRDRPRFVGEFGVDYRANIERFDHPYRERAWSFCDSRMIDSDRIRDNIVPYDRNRDLIVKSKNITNIQIQQNIVINRGPDVRVIQERTGRPVRHYRIEERRDHRDRDFGRVEGDRIEVYRPKIQRAEFTQGARERIQKSDARKKIEQRNIERGTSMTRDKAQAVPPVDEQRRRVEEPVTTPDDRRGVRDRDRERQAPGTQEVRPGEIEQRRREQTRPEAAPDKGMRTREDLERSRRGQVRETPIPEVRPGTSGTERPAAAPERPRTREDLTRERGATPSRPAPEVQERGREPETRPSAPSREERPSVQERGRGAEERPSAPSRPDVQERGRESRPSAPSREERPNVQERGRESRPSAPDVQERGRAPEARPSAPSREERPSAQERGRGSDNRPTPSDRGDQGRDNQGRGNPDDRNRD